MTAIERRPPVHRTNELGVIMTGGGARAAYQVGVLRGLARIDGDLPLPIVTGVSAGAINAVHLARRSGTFADAVERLTDLWANLRTEDVLRADALPLTGNVLRWGARLMSGGSAAAPQPRGMVDTEPLRGFLRAHFGLGEDSDSTDPIPGIHENIASGRLQALSVTTTSFASGYSITWCQGRDIPMWERPLRRSVQTRLTVEHVMASAALPFLFPAVRLGDEWHGDGGIRLTTPLSAALHLGAGRMLAVATRRRPLPRQLAAEEMVHYPPPAQVMGVLLNAIFLDAIDTDAMNMERINDVLRAMPEAQRQGLRPVELLIMRPSQDLGALAAEHERELPRGLRFLMRGWGTREAKGGDSLAMLLFEPGYTQRLIELGEADAWARRDELTQFFERARAMAPVE